MIPYPENGTKSNRNLNTILLWATLAGLGFISWMGYTNSVSLAKLEGSMMGRQEVEAKIAEVKVSQTSLDKELTALKLALAERGITAKKQQ